MVGITPVMHANIYCITDGWDPMWVSIKIATDSRDGDDQTRWLCCTVIVHILV